MINPIVRSFHAHDMTRLVNRDGEQCDPEQTISHASHGPSFTAEHDGKILGCGGVVVVWPGMGACWMMLAEDIGTHGIWLSKVTIDFMRKVKRDLKLHRLEACAVHESIRNQKWLELCGFTREDHGIARKYLADQRSIVRYEWVED